MEPFLRSSIAPHCTLLFIKLQKFVNIYTMNIISYKSEIILIYESFEIISRVCTRTHTCGHPYLQKRKEEDYYCAFVASTEQIMKFGLLENSVEAMLQQRSANVRNIVDVFKHHFALCRVSHVISAYPTAVGVVCCISLIL